MQLIFDQIKQQKKQNLPFVLYRKPNSKSIILILQENDHVYFTHNYTDKGFVFATFNDANNIIFPLEFSKISFDTFKEKKIRKPVLKVFKTKNDEKLHFTELITKAVKVIREGILTKVVLSRSETLKIKNFKLKKTFVKIMQSYPTAFCYYWYHPKVGTWMGASPEKLVSIKSGKINTTALAGTQVFQDIETVVWKSKEKAEQEIVAHFLSEKLKTFTSKLQISKPYTFKAGNVVHLKTDFEGELIPNITTQNIIEVLHPTPAICGFPMLEAKQYILENENYDRTFYTGFFGELNYDFNTNEEASDLHVNLRCMKIEQDTANEKSKISLFMGCGITKDSIPENEWEETVNKSKTMKSIL